MELELIIGIAAAALGLGGFWWWRKGPVKSQQSAATQEVVKTPVETAPILPEEKSPGWETKLGKTRAGLGKRLTDWFASPEKSAAAEWEKLEEVLLEGDVGVATAQSLVARVRERQPENGQSMAECFREETEKLLASLPHGALPLEGKPKPLVISIVGINGVGKTTTIGKLAQHFKSRGCSVLLGAGDTFRAGAIAQLKTWADRVGTEFVTGREGADPGAVAFDSVTAGKSRALDIVLLDTAGRLHTKSNLMDELKKIHRVIKKVIPEAPHETWLVIDGTLGQNSLNQAKEFQKALELTGIIVTKLDGTAKGGAVLAIASELKLPIRFIGVGEAVEDLVPFEPKPFVHALLGN